MNYLIQWISLLVLLIRLENNFVACCRCSLRYVRTELGRWTYNNGRLGSDVILQSWCDYDIVVNLDGLWKWNWSTFIKNRAGWWRVTEKVKKESITFFYNVYIISYVLDMKIPMFVYFEEKNGKNDLYHNPLTESQRTGQGNTFASSKNLITDMIRDAMSVVRKMR